MKKLHKLVASILAFLMLLTSANFAALAAEVADVVEEAVTDVAPSAVSAVILQDEGGELPTVGVLDGIDIDWENYKAESTGTQFTRDYTLGLSDIYDDVPSTGTEDRFNHVRASLPDEVPVFAPYTKAEIANTKVKFYVSPNGDDDNPGTIDEPFATPYRAVKAVNALKSKRGGVTVYFRGGTYPLSTNLDFSTKTSGVDEKNLVFFSNYENEKVVFTGSMAIEGKEFKKADDAKFKSKVSSLAQPHIVSVDLKALGYNDFGSWSATSRPSLYVDGAVYTIARWPNGANTSMAQYTGKDEQNGVKNKGYQSINSELGAAGSGTGGFAFKYSNPRPRNWENTGNIWMYGYWYAEWSKEHQLIEKFDLDQQIVYTTDGLSYGGKYVKGNTFYYYNIFEELDQPGEWYLDDKTGMLYIYPINEIKDNSLVQIVTTELDLIRLLATKYTVINGINFDMGKRAVVNMNDSMYNIVQRCHIKNMSTYALTTESGMYNGFICNLIEAENSIQIYGANGNSLTIHQDPRRTGNFAQNNYCKRIQNSGRGNVMSHNLLNGQEAMGLYINGGGELICEYNEVVAGPDEQVDAGMIYVNGGQTNYGQIIRYNYLNRQTVTMRSAPYCMYLDDISSGMYCYGNILREGRTFVHGGQYNTIYNNLTFDSGENFNSMLNSNNYNLSNSRWEGWVLTGTRYTSGIPDVYGMHWMDRYPYIYEWHSRLIPHRYDFYNNPNYDITNDPKGEAIAAPQDNVYINNVFINANIDLDAASREIDRVDENNLVFKQADIEKFGFEDYEFGIMNPDPEAWAKLCPGVEMPKPNHMFGIVYDPATIPSPMKLGPIFPQSPANQTENPIMAQGVVLGWNEVYGKSSYIVTLAKDPEFKDIVLEQEQQAETLALPVLDYDQTYYWKVKTTMWTNKFDQTPVEMPVATFKTMSLEEAERFVELDTSTLEANIGEMKKAIERGIIEEGTEAAASAPADMPKYKAGTLGKMKAIYEETKAALEKGFTLQKEVEALNSTAMKNFWLALEENAIPYEVNMGTGSHQFVDDGSFKPNNANLNPQFNGDTLIMDGSGSSMMAGQKMTMNSGATFRVNVTFDQLSQWTGIVMKGTSPVSGGFTSVIGYGVVFKPDIIELQRYPKAANDSTNIFVEVVNNEEIVRGGVPFDFESTVKLTKDGVHVVCMVDGEVIIDFLDKTAPAEVWGPGYYGFMHNSGNTKTTYSAPKGGSGVGDDGFFSTIALEKAIVEAQKFDATVTEGEPGEKPNYKVGTKAKLADAISAAQAAITTAASKADVTAAVEALNAVVADVNKNDANECTYTVRELDLSQWKLTSSLAAATIEENGGIIAIVPDEEESTGYEFKQPLTSKQLMRFTLKYDNTGNWDAISTRKVASGLTPTQSRGYFFVIKDDLIEFQKYTAKGKGTIPVKVENNNTIFKPGETYEVVIGSVNVEGGVLNILKINGETIIEYLDSEDPIYEQGYFALQCHSTLGRKALGAIPKD